MRKGRNAIKNVKINARRTEIALTNAEINVLRIIVLMQIFAYRWTKKYCGDWKYLNLYDARVVTEINAACNSGIDKKAGSVRIIFKNGFTGEY